MIHFALFCGVLFRQFFRSSSLGSASRQVLATETYVLAETRRSRMAAMRRAQRLGINPEEEAHHLKKHGAREVLLPATILEEDLPEGFETAVGAKVAGQYVFKPSEWNELWQWVLVKTARASGNFSAREGMDGFWLLRIGEARWKDPAVHAVALANSLANDELWVATGMKPQQES